MSSADDIPHYRVTLESPVGTLSLVATDSALVALVWRTAGHSRVPFEVAVEDPQHPLLRETARQLQEYFAGARRQFDLPLEFRGTDFQRRVWAALLMIPYGETRSYGQIAEQLGNPAAVRADLLRRLGRNADAAAAYHAAIALCDNARERDFLQRQCDVMARN